MHSRPHQTRVSVANPLRSRELLELAGREAFALAADLAQHDAMQRLRRMLPAEWPRRYHLPRIGWDDSILVILFASLTASSAGTR